MVNLATITKSIKRLANNLGIGYVKPTDQAWVSMNLRTSELARGRFAPKDGAEYIPLLRGWGDMCAKKTASTCARCEMVLLSEGGKGAKIDKVRRKRLMKSFGNNLVEVESSSALDLLNNPGDLDTAYQLKYMRFYSKDACGNAFMYWNDSQHLMTLRPQFTAPIMVEELSPIQGWVYGRGREREVAIPFDNVEQFKHLPNIDSPWLGDGPLKVCCEYQDLLLFSTVAEAARWRNGNPPPYAVMMPETITDPTKRDQAVKEIERQLNGPENAGNRIVLSAAEIKPLGFPPKDMEYIGGTKVSSHMVCAAFDIPESLIWPNESSLATAQEAKKHFYEFCIMPRLDRDAQQLTEVFRRRGLISDRQFFSYVNPSEEDDESAAKFWDIRIRNGSATPDECREDFGEDPLPNGLGTLPRQDGTLLSNEPPEPKVLPAGNADNGKPPAPGDRQKMLVEKDRVSKPKTREEVQTDLRDALIIWFLLLFDDVKTATVTVIPGIVDTSVGVTEIPMGNVPHGTPLATHTHYAVPAAMVDRFDSIVSNGHTEAVRAKIALEAETSGQFAISPAKSIEIVNAHRKTILEKMTATTNTDLRAAINNGLAQGKTIDQISEDLKASGYSAKRAELIAETEVAYASEVAAKEFGLAHGLAWKSWYLGPVPCPVCVEIKDRETAAGGATPIEQAFYGGVECPPVHPNCYCTVVYHNRPPSGGV